jgi:hypothetical protein
MEQNKGMRRYYIDCRFVISALLKFNGAAQEIRRGKADQILSHSSCASNPKIGSVDQGNCVQHTKQRQHAPVNKATSTQGQNLSMGSRLKHIHGLLLKG